MRVCIVTGMYPTKAHPNYGIFVADQVKALREAGTEVDVLFINPKKSRLNYGLVFPRLVQTLRLTPYDIVHTHHTYSLLLVELARRLTGVRIPVVFTNHEGEVLDRGGTTRTWHPTSRLRHSLRVKRFAAKRADFTIFVSRQVAEIVGLNVPHEVIPCGVDLRRFEPLDQIECRARLTIPHDAPVVFFPNNPQGMGKRFSLVQAAFKIVRRRLPNAVLLTGGSIPHDDMPIYYNAADVVLQASYYEASPTVVKETLACEVPLVSTDSGDTREVVDGVPYCFVCRDDPAEFADHIFQCVGHRAVGGRQRLRAKELGLDQTANRVMRVYHHLSNGKRG